MAFHHPDELPAGDSTRLPADAVIAVDGPAGSGKSSTARALADRFGLLYIDTGAMYRALTQAALAAGVGPADGAALAALLRPVNLELRPSRGETTVLWDGHDVSQAIRTPEVETAVSEVSSHPEVRRLMVERQQALGRRGGVIMEGRDIGSVVFPLATAKLFLTASPEARAGRRHRQFQQRGVVVDPVALAAELAARDRQDSERATSPLMISPDAIVIDSSALTFEQQNELCARACLVNPALDAAIDHDPEAVRLRLPFRYRLAYGIMRTLAHFYGLRVFGNRGLPVPPGCILAVNHIAIIDPVFLGATFRRSRVHALAKEELFRPAWLNGRFFRWLDAIPIRRKGYDRNAFGEAAAALTGGNNLLIFPEGTRQAIGHPGHVRSGLGILVQETRAPVLPMFLRGVYGLRCGGSLDSPLEVWHGPLLRWHAVDDLLSQLDRREVSDRIGQLCRAAWCELQARSFAGHPETPFEKETGQRQLRRFSARQAKLFGG
jgi:cytidylate kinase